MNWLPMEGHGQKIDQDMKSMVQKIGIIDWYSITTNIIHTNNSSNVFICN